MNYIRTIIIAGLLAGSPCTFSQNNVQSGITFSNSIEYTDTSFSDLPGNGFLIDIGDEVLAVTCKHTLWVNRPEGMKTISFDGKLKAWKMYVINDPSQYVIAGDLINANNKEAIEERNTDEDYLVFKVRENHSLIKPLILSTGRAVAGDTIYQVGWTYGTKSTGPQSYPVIVSKYLGPALLANPVIQQNYAGLSGSPVVNKNNELVAIVSSWKPDAESGKWFNAPCSVDYLWQVLYSYWLAKNIKQKSINSFQEFLESYRKLNNSKPAISSYLYTELFFADWLKSKGFKYGSPEKYSQWIAEEMKTVGIEIIPDNYIKSRLIFDQWKEDYIIGNSDFNDLKSMLSEAGALMPGMISFCEFSQELLSMEQYEKAVSLLLSADEIIQHMGQLYAYLGDAYLAKGERDQAKENYMKCLSTYPEYPKAVEGILRLR